SSFGLTKSVNRSLSFIHSFRNVVSFSLMSRMDLKKKAALVSLAVSIFVFAIKLLAYYYSRSEAVFSDAVEGIVNILAAFFALWSIQMALKPVDIDHPYGHG